MKLMLQDRKEQLKKNSKVEEELVQAQNMRKASLETCETLKRKENDTGEGSQKRSRRSTSNDFISYFSEKHERKISLRQEELLSKIKNKRIWWHSEIL